MTDNENRIPTQHGAPQRGNTQRPSKAQTAQSPSRPKTEPAGRDAAARASAGILPAQAPSAHTARNAGIAIAIAAVIIAIGIGIFLSMGGGEIFDSAAQEGQAPYKTAEEMQAELDRIVEEGMFNISIASVIEFDDGTSEGTAYVENVPGNRYNMQCTITEDDTGDVLYESGVLKPNQYIEKIKLSKDLDAGSYPATATFTALDTSTNQEVGQAAAKVTISVAN